MSYAFPSNLYFSVVRTSATMSLHFEADTPRLSESFSLVLRASQDTNVVLSTGQRLEDVDIHLMLSTKWRTAQELDQDLMIDDVGFLTHVEGERGEPFVHGVALLLNTTIVASLLCAGTKGKIKLVLPTVPFEERTDAPYIWGWNNRGRTTFVFKTLKNNGGLSPNTPEYARIRPNTHNEATHRFTCVSACYLAVWKLTTPCRHAAASSCYRGVRTTPRTGL